jgi:3-dehydroquinate dehydratase-2
MAEAEGAVPTIMLLSGPNLNLLGERQPEIYGTTTLAELEADARAAAADHGYALEHLQSNHEGTLVDAIHDARRRCDAIVINAGALTHYSYSIADALAAFDGAKVELHISDPRTREEWRHLSVIEPYVDETVQGLGGAGYRVAVEAAIRRLKETA